MGLLKVVDNGTVGNQATVLQHEYFPTLYSLMDTLIAFQVIPTSNEINHTVGVPNGVPNGVPKVTITYADQLDLEESVVPTISPNTKILATDPVFKTETNVVIKKKNGFKTKLNSFSPMEPIEECSMEMSSEKKDVADSR